MSLFGFLARHVGRYVGWIVIATLAAALFAAATLSVVALIEPVFDEVLQAGDPALELPAGASPIDDEQRGRFKRFLDDLYEDLKASLGIDGDDVVWFLPLLVVVVYLVRSVSHFVSGYSFNRIGLGVTTDIRNELYSEILSQSSRFHTRHSSGELMSRIVSDVGLMQTAVSTRVVDLLQQSLTLIGLVIHLFSLNARLATVCFIVLPVIVFPIVRFGRGMRKTSHKSQERMAELANLVAEGIRGHRVVKAFGMERFEYERFFDATRRHLRINLWAQMLTNLSSPVVESIAVVGAALLLFWAGQQIRAEELSAPTFIAFLFNLFWMYEPVRKLNRVNLVLQQSLAAAKRVFDVMREPNEIQDAPGARQIDTLRESVSFEGVSFAYEDRAVLHGVDLTIHQGEVVALVGPSGGGKTTLVNLLLRFFDPDNGSVRIDGLDCRDATLESLRSLIGIVTQETVLFNDTVRANIAYGRADLPLEKIRSAAEAAYADEFIRDLPEGYDTLIGESGFRLSGGQRQRLAIARALVKDPPILVLDEATSHLDSESEALVQKALTNLMRGRTTLVIAHRLSTVKMADRIIVMDGGRIVEEGSHSELLALEGLYKRLYDLQFRD